MPANRYLPYLTPPPQAILALPWVVKDERGKTVPPDDFARTWTYTGSSVFERRLILDSEAILDALGHETGEIGIMCTWRSSGSGLRERLAAGRVPAQPGLADVIVRGSVPRAWLSGTIEFRTRLSLTQSGRNPSPLSPPRGAVFWETNESVPIGDGTTRFPIVEVPFSSRGDVPNGAKWKLQVDGEDLHSHALQSVTLFVNTEAPLFQYLRDDCEDHDASAVHRRYLEGEIRRQLILLATIRADELDELTYADESLGALLQHVLSLHFPNMTAVSVRELAADPMNFDAALQAGMLHFWNG